jgi:hypothetical protein
MKNMLVFLVALQVIVRADVEVDTWIIPVRIHFNNSTSRLAWIEHNPNTFYYRNPENGQVKRPIAGKKVLFLNKLGCGDSLTISDHLYSLPDSFQCLIDRKISLDSVDLIEDARCDSMEAIGIWGSRRLSEAAGNVILHKKPVFCDLIILEQEAAYNAEHVYCYDPSFTKAQIRKLYKSGGRTAAALAKAIRENRIIFLEEVTP